MLKYNRVHFLDAFKHNIIYTVTILLFYGVEGFSIILKCNKYINKQLVCVGSS